MAVVLDDEDDLKETAGSRRGSISRRQSSQSLISDKDMFVAATSADHLAGSFAKAADDNDGIASACASAADRSQSTSLFSPTHDYSSRRSSVVPRDSDHVSKPADDDNDDDDMGAQGYATAAEPSASSSMSSLSHAQYQRSKRRSSVFPPLKRRSLLRHDELLRDNASASTDDNAEQVTSKIVLILC